MAQETKVQSQVESYQTLKKWFLLSPRLTLSIMLCIKGKVDQFKERSSALPYTLV